jgi:crossover junction endodeoxyribonuclease RuvC
VKYYIGVDPGAKGALAYITSQGICAVWDYDDPKWQLFLRIVATRQSDGVMAMIESAHAMPKQGVSSMFNFGKNYGRWHGWFDALQIPYQIVTPQKWKKKIFDSAPKKGEDQKQIALDLAHRLYPSISLTGPKGGKKDGRADSLLIARYCQKMEGGKRAMK